MTAPEDMTAPEAPPASPSQQQTCPRRMEDFGPWKREENLDSWREDDSCSFCGSLNPVTFMARLAAGTVQLVPTDKGYKVYVRNRGGEQFKQTYRTDKGGSADPKDWVWETRERDETKFYFQHLSVDDRKSFVDLLNTGKLFPRQSGLLLPAAVLLR